MQYVQLYAVDADPKELLIVLYTLSELSTLELLHIPCRPDEPTVQKGRLV